MSSEPAFPVSTSDGMQGHQDGAGTWQFPGMTLRDYFAAKAMNGFLCLYIAEHLQGDPDPQVLAEHAYEVADAMLKAREA